MFSAVKVGTKLFVALIVPIVVVMALFAYLDQRRGRALLQAELARGERAIAHTARLAIEDYLREHWLDEVRQLAEDLTGYEHVRGLRVFDAHGELIYQSVALESQPPADVTALRRSLVESNAIETRRTVSGERVVSHLMPLLDQEGRVQGALEVVLLESFIDEDSRGSRNFTILLAAVTIGVTGTIVLVVTRLTVTRSVSELARSFREVGSGDLSARVPVRHGDEFGRLAQEFNGMCARLERSQAELIGEHEARRAMKARLHTVEHLASLGRVAAGLAHAIGTPLNVISGRAETLQRALSGSEPAGRGLRIITEQIERITRIVRSFLDFGRARSPSFGRVDVASILHNVLELLDLRLVQERIRVEAALPAELPALPADADQLHEVFLNLALNAVDAMPRGGTLAIRGGVVERPHPEEVGPARSFLELAFADTGGGIAPELLDRVFEPFFTSKEIGKGTGLGLSVSYGIVREHGGWLQVTSELGRGSTFVVYLPLTRPARATVALGRAV